MADENEKKPQSEIVQLPNAIYGRIRLENGFDAESLRHLFAWAEEIDKKGENEEK